MLGKIWYNILCIVTFARACPYAPTRIYNKNDKNTLKKVALKLKEKRRYKQTRERHAAHSSRVTVTKMSEKQKYYVTTAIAYASKKPHFGNTYEAIMTDALTRWRREMGYDVFMCTGTDEHGQKIEELEPFF